MRQTKQKDIILQALYDNVEHPTAEMLYAGLKKDNPHLSLATVYRNLNLFAEEGIVKKLDFPSEPARFDITTLEHPHAVCRQCGTIFDVPGDSLVPVTNYIKQVINEDLDFEIDNLEILASGVCSDCRVEDHSFKKAIG